MSDDDEPRLKIGGLSIPGRRAGQEEQRVLGFPVSWFSRAAGQDGAPGQSAPGRRLFAGVQATDAEKRRPRPGDQIVDPADVVMDRAFTVSAAPEVVWPWLLQLGKRRAGWYLTRRAERFLPRGRRAARTLNPAWLALQPGDVIPDYGGRDETFEVAQITPPSALVYRSQRGRARITWSLNLEPAGPAGSQTRVSARLRMAPVRHQLLARTAGELIDAATIAAMAAGLRERLADGPPGS